MTTVDLRLGDWRTVLDGIECDAFITDAPYSEKTHTGHRVGVEGSEKYMRVDRRTGSVYSSGRPARRDINYGHLTPDDVRGIVESWAPRTRGWMVSMTDHHLAQAWADAMSDAGRYVFAPLPVVTRGGTVRLAGDGPSSWTVWLVVSRPRSMSLWGTLDGAYVITRGGEKNHIGGKPPHLMRAILGDYTNPGDVVCDPFAGWGTTLLAARELGCRAIGAEIDEKTHAMATARLAKPWQPTPHPRGSAMVHEQVAMFSSDLK